MAINPITNENWEGIGGLPDIQTVPAQALNVAYGLALETVIRQVGKPASRPFKRLLEEAQESVGWNPDQNHSIIKENTMKD